MRRTNSSSDETGAASESKFGVADLMRKSMTVLKGSVCDFVCSVGAGAMDVGSGGGGGTLKSAPSVCAPYLRPAISILARTTIV